MEFQDRDIFVPYQCQLLLSTLGALTKQKCHAAGTMQVQHFVSNVITLTWEHMATLIIICEISHIFSDFSSTEILKK